MLFSKEYISLIAGNFVKDKQNIYGAFLKSVLNFTILVF